MVFAKKESLSSIINDLAKARRREDWYLRDFYPLREYIEFAKPLTKKNIPDTKQHQAPFAPSRLCESYLWLAISKLRSVYLRSNRWLR